MTTLPVPAAEKTLEQDATTTMPHCSAGDEWCLVYFGRDA